MKNLLHKLKSWLLNKKHGFITLLYVLLNSTLIYYCLELGNKNPFMNGFLYTLINILTVFVIQAAIYLIFQKWWISSLISEILLTTLSIANYYTILYRNQPISTQDIHNIGTTLSVIDGYNFPMSFFVVAILIFFILSILITIVIYFREKGRIRKLKNIAIKNICLLLFCVLFTNSVYLSDNSIKPRNTFVWSWQDSYHTYGYAASSIEVLQNSINMVNMPENYSADSLKDTEQMRKVIPTEKNTPDIILILNETFYDLRDILDIETDVEIMPFIDNLENSIKGRVVVAGTGGGTNKSEYELLTSNSLQLMPGITPFNYLDFKNSNSIVSYLKSLGYSTWGAHCAESLNYSRGIVYPELGFENVLFNDSFGKTEKYGTRSYATDKFCYDKLLEDYESMGASPRFMYLLTIQNHGGWELNDSSLDTVKSSTDFGDYTDDIDEFLSCMQLSDNAFKYLTDYFSKSDRPTIICMLGDHAPAFAPELVDISDNDVVLKLRSTPYIIWSNFEMKNTDIKNTSMPYIVPNLLHLADAPLSEYYSYMLRMQKDVPIITALDAYYDKNGNSFKYSDKTPYYDTVQNYLKLVYNNVNIDGDRIEKIFEPDK